MIQIQQNQTLYVYLCICPVQNGKWPISNLNFAHKNSSPWSVLKDEKKVDN